MEDIKEIINKKVNDLESEFYELLCVAFENGFFIYNIIESWEGEIKEYDSISDPDDFLMWVQMIKTAKDRN